MDTRAIIASLCYFSVLFLPFLFPIVVYFVSEGELKGHAKASFISHIIPIVSFIILFFFALAVQHMIAGLIIAFVVFGIINIVVFVWNLVKGVKILLKEVKTV